MMLIEQSKRAIGGNAAERSLKPQHYSLRIDGPTRRVDLLKPKLSGPRPIFYNSTVIRIGVAGWKYKDWEGIVYPAKPRPRGFDELAYISKYFDSVEINSSYYGAPRPTSAKKWVESVSGNESFRFTAKLFHAFTHERKPAPNDEKDFKDGIAPLIEAGRFGALLIQFPWSFKNSTENRGYLISLQKRFQEYPLVVEVRHGSWIEDDILDLFSDLGIGICNIDQPLFHRSVKPAAHVTSTIGYVRLHGRNYRQWFSREADVRERYDHLYSLDELDPWVDRTKQIAQDAKDTYVVSNNHNLGKAVVNALDIRALVTGKPVDVPPYLMASYPDLKEISSQGEYRANMVGLGLHENHRVECIAASQEV